MWPCHCVSSADFARPAYSLTRRSREVSFKLWSLLLYQSISICWDLVLEASCMRYGVRVSPHVHTCSCVPSRSHVFVCPLTLTRVHKQTCRPHQLHTCQRASVFRELLSTFQIRPATWLRLVPISQSSQCSWWGLVLAKTHPAQWVTLASSLGHSQILSHSRGEEGLGSKLRHGLQMVDSVST